MQSKSLKSSKNQIKASAKSINENDHLVRPTIGVRSEAADFFHNARFENIFYMKV